MASDLPEWVQANYPTLAPVVHDVAQLFRQYVVDGEVEIEMRLMRPREGGWTTDVGFELQDKFLARCGDAVSDGMLSFSEWEESADYFYNHAGAEIRTRVRYCVTNYSVQTTSIVKTRCARCDVVAPSQIGVRVDAKREAEVPDAELPRAVTPHRVSLLHRCSATCAATDGGAPMWRYDITMSWSGASRSEAETKQQEDPPAYLIELEYIGGASRLQQLGAEYVACSGLLKVLDIYGPCCALLTRN